MVAHKAGCPAGQIMNFGKFVHTYPWLFGIILVLGGPIVLLFGRRFFPWVMAGIVAVSGGFGAFMICSVLGFMETTIGLVISAVGSACIGLLAGFFVMKTGWIAVGILGVLGGFFIGSILFGMLLAITKWSALWAMIFFQIFCALVGGFLSFKFSKQVVLICTCLIGSFAFSKGVGYFVGGFPDTGVIMSQLK